MRHAGIGLLVVVGILSGSVRAEEPVFSGPQVGEKLAGFKVTGVYDDAAGKEFDPVAQAAGKPTVVVFVHKVTRPSIGLTRLLMNYAAKRKKDGLHSTLVFLSEDSTETVAWMKRARGAIPKDIPVGISPDGKEGPGAYGLNRNVTLTVLVAKENKVTANFALVQPSVQADLTKIVKEVVKLVGGKVPTLAQLGAERYDPKNKKKKKKGRQRGNQQDPNLRGYLAPVIQKDASPEDVDEAVAKLEKYLEKNPKTRVQVGDIARRIIKAGKLKNYGTKHAQEYLTKWSKEFVAEKKRPERKKTEKKKSEK